MDNKLIASRRQALGLATLAGAAAAGPPLLATPRKPEPARPADQELARLARLYAGEFGGGRGARGHGDL